MCSSSKTAEQIDHQHKTQKMRNFTNRVKGLKEKISELATSNWKKMKSWSENKPEVLQILRKFKGKKIEKKEETEKSDEKTDDDGRVSSMEEELMSKDSMLKWLSEVDEKLEKTMERIGVLEAEFERELARRCIVKEEEEEEMNDGDESESGYCTPDPDLDRS